MAYRCQRYGAMYVNMRQILRSLYFCVLLGCLLSAVLALPMQVMLGDNAYPSSNKSLAMYADLQQYSP